MPSDVGERLRREIADRAYHVCEYCLVHEEDPTIEALARVKE